MRHVLHVIDSLHGGGSETSLLEVVPELRRLGTETSIATLLPDDAALSGRLAELGVEVHALSHHSLARRLAALYQLLRSGRFDVVHTSLIWADLVGRLAASTTSLPVVTSLVNLSYGPEHRSRSEYRPLGVRAWQALDIAASRRTTLFHAVSEEVASVMARRLCVPRDRIRVVYRGRDQGRIGTRSPARRDEVRRRLGLAADAHVILAVGRLDQQKAADVAVAAFRQLTESPEDLVLLIAGRDGNATADARAAAAGDGRIVFLGHRPDVPDLMCAADCLAFPTRWEGLPGTIIEALALELPLVASNIPPTREALGGVQWPLVPVDDPSALAAALGAVLSGGVPVQSLRIQGRTRFEEDFTTQQAAAGMAGLYDEVAFIQSNRRHGRRRMPKPGT